MDFIKSKLVQGRRLNLEEFLFDASNEDVKRKMEGIADRFGISLDNGFEEVISFCRDNAFKILLMKDANKQGKHIEWVKEEVEKVARNVQILNRRAYNVIGDELDYDKCFNMSAKINGLTHYFIHRYCSGQGGAQNRSFFQLKGLVNQLKDDCFVRKLVILLDGDFFTDEKLNNVAGIEGLDMQVSRTLDFVENLRTGGLSV